MRTHLADFTIEKYELESLTLSTVDYGTYGLVIVPPAFCDMMLLSSIVLYWIVKVCMYVCGLMLQADSRVSLLWVADRCS